MFIDTHAHVFAEEFSSDFDACLERSITNGVSKVMVPNIDESSIEALISLCDKFPANYFPLMGLHPCSVGEDYQTVLERIFLEFISKKYYGVGEIGMDLYWDKTTYEIQKLAFIEQAQWAIKYDLPVSIHSRDSTQELIKIIQTENLKQLRGVFHCFSGDESEAETLINMGFYLGIGGVVTFKNSGLKSVLKNIGIEKLVLETDSPYLAPVPYRGKRNETSYIPYIANELALLFNLNLEKVAEITRNNSEHVFGI